MEKLERENPPEHVRVGGVEVTIWKNNSDGTFGPFATVTMQRNYKDKNDQWQKTQSLRANDIPKAVLALQKAYEQLVLKED